MLGLRFLVNGIEIAAVSNEGRNIISAYISGDVIGSELGEAHMTGGFYDNQENTSHRIWLDHHVIYGQDEIEIQFSDKVVTSGRGMTIEEFSEVHENDAYSDIEEDIYDWLDRQPKFRKCFSFSISGANNKLSHYEASDNAHSFHFGVMWKLTNPNEASVRLSSSTLENMKKNESSTTHIAFRLSPEESVRFRVKCSVIE